MIMACSCSSYNVTETIGTLRFGVRAKKVENKAQVNSVLSIEEYKQMLDAAKAKREEQQLDIST